MRKCCIISRYHWYGWYDCAVSERCAQKGGCKNRPPFPHLWTPDSVHKCWTWWGAKLVNFTFVYPFMFGPRFIGSILELFRTAPNFSKKPPSLPFVAEQLAILRALPRQVDNKSWDSELLWLCNIPFCTPNRDNSILSMVDLSYCPWNFEHKFICIFRTECSHEHAFLRRCRITCSHSDTRWLNVKELFCTM